MSTVVGQVSRAWKPVTAFASAAAAVAFAPVVFADSSVGVPYTGQPGTVHERTFIGTYKMARCYFNVYVLL